MPTLSPELAQEYQHLFDSCVITRYEAVDKVVNKILDQTGRYKSVSDKTGVPWYFIGIIHILECGGSFKTHLHNGDPLSAPTVHVPKNRPPGNPPFAWEYSAVDSLQLEHLGTWTDWSLSGMLFKLEGYNGYGYRKRGINSPYLWSFSNLYSKGKFAEDGIYDPDLVSKQCGGAVILRRMSERQIAVIGKLDLVTQIKTLGKEVAFAPKRYNQKAFELQTLLNNIGLHVRIDGYAGRMTSDAFRSISGKYLTGDN